MLENLKLITALKGTYDLYSNPQKILQSYNLQLELETKIDQFIISSSYNGKLRLPLGEASIKTVNSINTINIGLELDPNRKIKKDSK